MQVVNSGGFPATSEQRRGYDEVRGVEEGSGV
jgi:hypothetical protein